ncbi:TPA: hypothetical protein DIT45_00240, partial [Candidatus Acetothermia bacterium]|nr:hypothetical protein [Candidatus Acetothermia bacterium]
HIGRHGKGDEVADDEIEKSAVALRFCQSQVLLYPIHGVRESLLGIQEHRGVTDDQADNKKGCYLPGDALNHSM